MSQFNLTPEEDTLVLGAVRAKAAQYLSSQGVADPALEALVEKIQRHYPTPTVENFPTVEDPVVETPADVVEPTEAEVEAHFAQEVTVVAEETPAQE